jgi:membrane protease YdiL (CAAX protease family)
MKPSMRLTIAAAVGVTLASIALGNLVQLTPGWVSVLVSSSAAIVLCAVALVVVRRLKPRAIPAELGLVGSPVPAAALIAIASTAPTVVLLLAHAAPALPSAAYLLPIAVLAPLSEEVVFRGYLFQQLHRRAGWGFWPAASLSALLFGLAHVHGVARTLAAPMAVVVPTIGGIFFAWLFVRWKDNLWVPLGVHAALNFWWEVLHSTGDQAASQHAELARAVFVALAVVKTLRETPAVEIEG